jgi:hypothetical protein
VDADGYSLVDETIPPLATARYLGDENEEYGDSWTWRFGGRGGERQRYRFSLLRALQMRLRYLWTSPAAEEINPPLSGYVRRGLGRTVTDSPDAWAYLKESPIGNHVSTVGLARNFERWLRQRDIPDDGVTVPTERVDRSFNAGSIPDSETWSFYDHVARRTDVASGNRYIYFDLDDRFVVRGAVAIKVEIRDDSEADWCIEHTDRAHQIVRTPSYHGQADGQTRTITFTIDRPRFVGDFTGGMDFRIVCDGPGDVTVRWVRVVRLDEPL